MNRSKEVLNQFAKLASESFLTKKTPLNTSLKKLAKEEALEPHQIEYVASTANHNVWERLYGMDKKASYDFPVADAAAVITELQVKPKAIIKQASLDYLGAPNSDMMEKSASIQLSSIDKTASSQRNLKLRLEDRMQKMSKAQEEMSEQMIVLRSRYEQTEKQFLKEARNLVLDQPFSDRGQAMVTVAEFVKSAAENDKLAKDLMKKLSHIMGSQGFIKQADLKAPEEYISETLPAKIVNGRHALYITIKTLKEIHDQYSNFARGHEIVDSSLPELKEKIRAL